MKDISSEAKKAGLNEPVKNIDEMTEDELMTFRNSFNPDMMGFDGTEGIEEDTEDTKGNGLITEGDMNEED
jgi:hypothetical protein